jgi:hypothetical protein
MASEAPPPAELVPASDGGDGKPERYGPLELRRFTKKDGRMLILYDRSDEPDRDRT